MIGPVLEIEHDAGVLDGFPGGLEEESLLGLDVGRFARGDAEELGVELIDVADEAAASGDGFAEDAGFGVVEAIDVPAVGGDLGDGFASVGEEFPE